MAAPSGLRLLTRRLARWFAQGLLITVPAGITIYVTWIAVRWVDGLLGLPVPGLGLLVVLATVTIIGAFASTFVTRSLLGAMDELLGRVPFIRLLYTSLRDLVNAFVGTRRRFTRAVRVALSPDGAVSVLGFVTADDLRNLGLPGHVAVYLPQSYNFAGQLIVVPADRVTPLEAESGEVMALIVSGGVTGSADSAADAGRQHPPG
jgi:uncharacterized membrane protein